MTLKIDRYLLIILLAFGCMHIFLFFNSGIISGLESEKYILQADKLLAGSFPGAPKYYYYLPIIFLIALAKKWALGYGFVVIVQSVISAAALLLFYEGTKSAFNRKTALLSALALCFFFPFHSWDFFLYSDSVFISLSLLLYFLICKFEKQTLGLLLFVFLVLIFMVFARPFGVLFIPPLVFYFLCIKYRSRSTRLITLFASLAFIVGMYVSLQAVFHGGEDMDAMKPFIEEHIICFVANKPEGANLNLKYYDNGVKDIFYYVVHNPWHFTKLMAQRLFSFFKFIRPWYSTAHNLYLLTFMIPIYLLFVAGVVRFSRVRKNLLIYILALIILYPLAATLQCDDWHSRFTMPILPPIFAVAAYGFFSLLSNFTNKTN